MRGDQRLALQWLEQLSQHQPDHPQQMQFAKPCFKSVPKASSSPFK